MNQRNSIFWNLTLLCYSDSSKKIEVSLFSPCTACFQSLSSSCCFLPPAYNQCIPLHVVTILYVQQTKEKEMDVCMTPNTCYRFFNRLRFFFPSKKVKTNTKTLIQGSKATWAAVPKALTQGSEATWAAVFGRVECEGCSKGNGDPGILFVIMIQSISLLQRGSLGHHFTDTYDNYEMLLEYRPKWPKYCSWVHIVIDCNE